MYIYIYIYIHTYIVVIIGITYMYIYIYNYDRNYYSYDYHYYYYCYYYHNDGWPGAGRRLLRDLLPADLPPELPLAGAGRGNCHYCYTILLLLL